MFLLIISAYCFAILMLFWISNIFLIIFHIITNCNMSFLETRKFLVSSFLDLSFPNSTSSLYSEQLWVEINLKANVCFFKSVYIPLSIRCTCVRPLTAWECLPQFSSQPTALSLYTFYRQLLSHGPHSSRSGPSCTCLYTSVASSSDSLLSASHQADVILAPGRSTGSVSASGSCTDLTNEKPRFIVPESSRPIGVCVGWGGVG